jgi:hypothetical protein
MKKTLLIGLAAVALGSMTACSNILEEEGVISPSAKTGSLVVALEADGGVDVTTKASESVAIPTDLLEDMEVKATLSGSSPEQFVELTGEKLNNKYVYTHENKIKSGAYKVTATYDKTNDEKLCWDSPIFYGETNVIVKTGETPTEGSITATLQNSQIVLDETSYNTFDDKATISELYVHNGSTVPSEADEKFSLLETRTLYVKKGVRISPVIYGGGQEKGLRGGTENVSAIAGFGKAVELYNKNEKIIEIKKYIIDRITNEIPEIYVNGDVYLS